VDNVGLKLCGGAGKEDKNDVQHRVARFNKIKKAKFGHKQFQTRPNPEI